MQDKKFRYIFIVQGEGRGHMTQAITLFEMLKRAGHEIVHVFVGSSKRREIPDFFFKRIDAPITLLQSPNFVTDPQNKSVKVISSILYNMKYLKRYFGSLRQINQKVKALNPDVVINFYDFLGGFFSMFFQPKAKYVVLGHQYLASHPSFEFAEGKLMDKILFQTNNWLTAFGADKRLALSFADYQLAKFGKNTVTPPLLREEVFGLKVENGDFLLGYMVNDGYGEEIMQWSDQNPGVKIHCFWDRKTAPREYQYNEFLTFHQLDGQKFIDLMRGCKGLISTAGFESICEAMYLQKPVLMIPVNGQYEQACNAIDAEKSQAGIWDRFFNISRFLDYIPQHQSDNGFREWIAQTEQIFLKELTTYKK